MCVPPRKCLGLCLRVTNKGESGFGKANNRVKAKEYRLYGILGGSAVGCPLSKPSVERKKLDSCSKVIIGFPVSIPSALVKR